MTPLDPKESRFEPALLLALIAMVGVALGKDVFYDIASQAVAMSALALLILAFVMPLLTIVERVLMPRTTVATPEPAELEETSFSAEPVIQAALAPRVSLERNAGSAGAQVCCGAALRNENRSWTESFVTHRRR